MLLILRPGCHVLKRGDGAIQVGLDPRRAVVLPDTEAVRVSLRLLSSPADRTGHPDPAILDVLASNDLLIDERALMPLIPVTGTTPHSRGKLSRHGSAALALRLGDDVSQAVESRAACVVEVVCFGHTLIESWHAEFADQIASSGMRTGTGGSRQAPRRDRSHAIRSVGALVGVGEPRRDLVDEWVRTGTPHLLVRMVEGAAIVGPFVVPGQTACLRCVDAHCTDVDPSWPLLVAQYASATERDRVDGAPEPVDPALASIALAWAARDLATYAEGRRPSTWSTTITFDPHLTAIESQSWLRHPACGCSWG